VGSLKRAVTSSFWRVMADTHSSIVSKCRPTRRVFSSQPTWGFPRKGTANGCRESKERMRISIIGCGYVGLVTGGCLAEIGDDVMFTDNDTDLLAMLEAVRSRLY